MENELQPLLVWLIPLSLFLLILILGAANKIIIFNNTIDLAISTLPWITFACGLMLFDYLGSDQFKALDNTFELFFAHPHDLINHQQVIVIRVTLITAFLSALWTIGLSIKHNGSIFLGLFVGCFKLLTSLISIIVFIGQLGKIIDKSGNSGAFGPAVIIMFMFIIFASVLINGEDVRLRRDAKRQQTSSA